MPVEALSLALVEHLHTLICCSYFDLEDAVYEIDSPVLYGSSLALRTQTIKFSTKTDYEGFLSFVHSAKETIWRVQKQMECELSSSLLDYRCVVVSPSTHQHRARYGDVSYTIGFSVDICTEL